MNSIYTLFYGGFLQVFQTALGWKRIQEKDVKFFYQQAGSLLNIVYTVVMRGLHYMHEQWYTNESTDIMVDNDPATAALQLISSFDNFLTSKMQSSKDNVLRILINFINLTSRFIIFKEATTAGNLLMVNTIYNEYFPVLVYLNKATYYNIILDQIDEYYGRIPYYVLQWIRQNRFQKIYNGKDRKGGDMSH